MFDCKSLSLQTSTTKFILSKYNLVSKRKFEEWREHELLISLTPIPLVVKHEHLCCRDTGTRVSRTFKQIFCMFRIFTLTTNVGYRATHYNLYCFNFNILILPHEATVSTTNL